jgi:hypothetical protein
MEDVVFFFNSTFSKENFKNVFLCFLLSFFVVVDVLFIDLEKKKRGVWK